MGLVSQPKRDRLGHPMSSLSIYSCSLWCGSGVPTSNPPPVMTFEFLNICGPPLCTLQFIHSFSSSALEQSSLTL